MVCAIGCYQPIEGCLDTRATNFNAQADDDCPNCCTYPSMTFRSRYSLKDTNWTNRDTMVMASGEKIVLLDFDVIVGDFKWIGNQPGFCFREKENVDRWNGQEFETDTIKTSAVYLSPLRFTHNIGSFIWSGQLEEIQLQLPPVGQLQGVDPASLEENGALLNAANENNLWKDSTYTFIQLQYSKMNGDTVIRKITSDREFNISIPVDIEISPLESVSLQMEWNWGIFIEACDLNNDSNEEILEKWAQVGSEAIGFSE